MFGHIIQRVKVAVNKVVVQNGDDLLPLVCNEGFSTSTSPPRCKRGGTAFILLTPRLQRGV